MDNTTRQKERIIFPENIIQILSELLQKYNLTESESETSEKIDTDQPFYGEIIMDTVRDLMFGNIQEKNASAALQQKLNIQQNIAENLFADIKLKLLPFLQKIPDNEEENEKTEEIQPKKNTEPFIKKSSINIEAPQKKIKRVIPEEKIVIQRGQFNKKDNYREPIE